MVVEECASRLVGQAVTRRCAGGELLAALPVDAGLHRTGKSGCRSHALPHTTAASSAGPWPACPPTLQTVPSSWPLSSLQNSGSVVNFLFGSSTAPGPDPPPWWPRCPASPIVRRTCLGISPNGLSACSRFVTIQPRLGNRDSLFVSMSLDTDFEVCLTAAEIQYS